MNERTHIQDWLSDAPREWELPLLKLVAQVESGHTPSRNHPEYWVPEDCVVPWFSLADIWQLRDGRQTYLGDTKEAISQLGVANSGARVLPAGTVVLSRTASVGFSGIMPRPMATTQDFVNFVCGPRLENRFLMWVLRGMKPEFERLRRGSTHKTIYMPDLLQFRTPLPPLPTQKAIADFLDRKTAAIDALIEKKQKLLDLLAEKRAALINQAVTKGLDPDVPMKDSGIPWIGEIPAHWEVVPLRRCTKVIDCKHKTPEYVDDGFPIVSTTEVKAGRLDLTSVTRWVGAADYRDMTDNRTPARGDIIYSRNASLGAAAYVDTNEPFAMGQDVVLITAAQSDLLYLSYQLNSAVGMTQVDLACIGSTFKRINVGDIKKIQVCLPPPTEAAVIASHIDLELQRHGALQHCVEQHVTRLHEYRQALITAAVTGQVDISEEAA